MRDLGDLMWSAVDDRARTLDGLVPDAAELGDLRARVRRGRTVRRVREAAVALPVVAAVAAAGWFGLGRLTDAPPVPPATPDVVEPSPDQVPTPEPDDELVLGDPITEPGLPPYHAMPEGLLDRVGPGWVVASAAPRSAWDQPPTSETVFLVSPEGVRFAALRFDLPAGEERWVEHVPVQWDGGRQVVVATVENWRDEYGNVVSEARDTVLLDLETGETSGPVTVEPPDDGWGYLTSPTGRLVVGRAHDTAFTLDPTTPDDRLVEYGVAGRVCSALGWYDAESLLAHCVDAAAVDVDGYVADLAGVEGGLHRVWVDSSTPPVELQALDPVAGPWPFGFSGTWVRDGVVAFPSADGPTAYACYGGVDVWRDGRLERLQGPGERGDNAFRVQAAEGRVYVEAAPACSGDAQPSSITAHDLDAGTATVLWPVVDGPLGVSLPAGWAVAR